MLDVLPMNSNLKKKRMNLDGLCPLCNLFEESIEHLFLICD